MPNDPAVADAGARRRALDPAGSFIVQAPAGSGKTELLTQRFLRLLAIVDHPEEVLAITFTRKAAAEMRDRVLAALELAAAPCPQAPHRAATWKLARAAADRDAALDWRLLDTPGRLRVQTIDGLCAALTRQMPVTSELGAPPGVVDAAGPHYERAARRTVAALEEDLGEALAVVLPHLENDVERLVGLIAQLLPRREQWLAHLFAEHPRATLEAGLQDAIVEHLERVAANCPVELVPPLLATARYAAANLDGPDHPSSPLRDVESLPGASPEDLAAWLGLAELLLTRKGPELRRKVDARHGFPAPSQVRDAGLKAHYRQAKEAFAELVGALADHPGFVQALDACRRLPPPRYGDAQWDVLQALGNVLVRAAAELNVVFAERSEVDFTEVHLRALDALGSELAPTDLALALDYRLRHILVDEFQDTSSGQYQLIRRLTAGWQPGDGRTLFLVGDPMQSIYGFREAEVGLFLETRERGLGELRLEPLQLEVNFRSQAGIVDWVNRTFAAVLPGVADLGSGAVPYSPSRPFRSGEPGKAVGVELRGARDDDAEAARLVDLVRDALATDPTATVAVLGRNRSHLAPGAAALKAAGIGFQAVDLEPLAERPVVQDLRALTRALLHAADRLAWCTVLRAPYCGLALPDLLAAVGEGSQAPVWPRLENPDLLDGLSPDGRARVTRLSAVLAKAFAERRRPGLRSWIEGVWIALGGPATLGSAVEREAAAAYFDLLQREEVAGDLADLEALDDRLARLYAPPDPQADGRVQLMTMHKAKGLEFDVVILPGLGRRPRQDEPPLLAWQERPTRSGETALLLAPIRAARDDAEPIQAYLRDLAKTRARLEEGRLLYVAATRARRRLYLLGHVSVTAASEQPRPDGQSLLARLWPAVEADGTPLTAAVADTEAAAPRRWPLRRLPADWTPLALPYSPLQQATQPPAQPDEPPIPFDWAGQTARHVGTLVHRWLERIGREGVEAWPAERLASLAQRLGPALRQLGVAQAALEEAAERCVQALQGAVTDPRGRWILAAHEEHRVEYGLTAWQDGEARHFVIDRTFVHDGERWIIDYKTGHHEGGDLEAFLDHEQERYREQLERYAVVFQAFERRPVRLGLYFPLLPAWREWRPGERLLSI